MAKLLKAICVILVSLFVGSGLSGFIPMILSRESIGEFSIFSYIAGFIAGVGSLWFAWLFYKD